MPSTRPQGSIGAELFSLSDVTEIIMGVHHLRPVPIIVIAVHDLALLAQESLGDNPLLPIKGIPNPIGTTFRVGGRSLLIGPADLGCLTELI